MLKKYLLPFAVLLALAGCKPQEGDTCKAGSGVCDSNTAALMCDRGALKLFQCRGAGGCLEDREKDQLVCAFGNFKAGDPCPESMDNQGQCDASNANQVLKCTSGTMQAQTCKQCALQSGSIVCQP